MLSRREFLLIATGAGGGAVAGYALGRVGAPEQLRAVQPVQPIQVPARRGDIPLSSHDLVVAPPSPFDDLETSEIAGRLGIQAGTFFHVPEAGKGEGLLENLNAHMDTQLYPIYPPAVLARKELIYQLSDEFQIPPNVIATIMAIESTGVEDAGSWAGAIGLFQPLSDKFPLSVQQMPATNAEEVSAKLEAMWDPLTNGRAGIGYFKDLCLPYARRNGFPSNDARIFARALIAYNGGPGIAERPFTDLPDESKQYGDHFIRYVLTMQVAKQLRLRGAKDAEIVKKLQSQEIDARAFALESVLNILRRRPTKPYYDYDEYDDAARELGETVIPKADSISGLPTATGRKLAEAYQEYKARPVYAHPLTAGLRIWIAIAPDLSLYNSESRNQDLQNWTTVNTER